MLLNFETEHAPHDTNFLSHLARPLLLPTIDLLQVVGKPIPAYLPPPPLLPIHYDLVHGFHKSPHLMGVTTTTTIVWTSTRNWRRVITGVRCWRAGVILAELALTELHILGHLDVLMGGAWWLEASDWDYGIGRGMQHFIQK